MAPPGASSYLGPRLRRLRRDLGLTQAQMATDLEISPSYIALLERNQRPLTADLLLRLARTYKLDMAQLAADEGPQLAARLQAMLRDPMFADIELPPLEAGDVASNFPAVAEAMLRLHAAYQRDQTALADRAAEGAGAAAEGDDPVAEARRFIGARRNSFPALDDAAERLAEAVASDGGLEQWFRARHQLRVRYLPPDVLMGSLRRYDRHREEVLINDTLDQPSRRFQLALQLVYLAMRRDLDAMVKEVGEASESGRKLIRRTLANYAAAAVLMPYTAFARAVEARAYDVEALARHFGTSFEQTAHRLTTLHKPGHERVPFFFIRVDQAGNVSKRLDGGGFPFARHGGGCPLWSLHSVFTVPGQVVPQWIELPDGARYFSIARTVGAGGGSFGAPQLVRAIALVCAAADAPRLVYARAHPDPGPGGGTPIGVTCRLCHRPLCPARALPPVGRAILSDETHRPGAAYSLADE
ncbi:DUF2083 domain-containing protein [Novosphingobium flavum]|uniref:DUF2083 domain-containing protein n=1 Tax=Novosphingobium flavum TaxID=1778672 RepID=A0A7X1FS04_9SPHN|nr:helix-turn-helix transcriptional regulator [Novosphingobium flavum]MBC2665900.1 DUF2083 domain-containing protein [Novosphingobium flavum]